MLSNEEKAYFIRLGISLGLVGLFSYLSGKIMGAMMEEIQNAGRKKNKPVVYQKLADMGIDMDELNLTKHEVDICSMLVVPSSIDVTWSDIGGLEDEIQTLKETVILPIVRNDIFANSKSKLLSFPKGVLLSGPPGCGKTMIAKATAKESGCFLLNIDISMLHDMYVGESPKFVSAIFTLAEKLNRYSPVIVFIDEIDTLLGSRSSRDHENTQQIKGAFMMNWDGLISSKDTRIVVMGATNLPQVIDAAVYRRMPIRFQLKLPNRKARVKILRVLLQGEALDSTVDLEVLGAATNEMSGSDIKEYCSQSCMVRYREMFREQLRQDVPLCEAISDNSLTTRPVTMDDFRATAALFGNDSLARYFQNQHLEQMD